MAAIRCFVPLQNCVCVHVCLSVLGTRLGWEGRVSVQVEAVARAPRRRRISLGSSPLEGTRALPWCSLAAAGETGGGCCAGRVPRRARSSSPVPARRVSMPAAPPLPLRAGESSAAPRNWASASQPRCVPRSTSSAVAHRCPCHRLHVRGNFQHFPGFLKLDKWVLVEMKGSC